MLAFHGIITAYGFWLPNDPRGSWSDFVAAWDLYIAGGPANRVTTARSVAAAVHDSARRLSTKNWLAREPVRFTGQQALSIRDGFSRAVDRRKYRVLACAIMPDHVHLVLAASQYDPADVLAHFKREASLALKVAGRHPFQAECIATGKLPQCWAEGCWKVYLDTLDDVRRAIKYVEENPLRAGFRRQHWPFVMC